MYNIKTVFDQIHAGEQLKENTLLFLQDRIQQAEPKRSRPVLKRLIAACACLLILTLTAIYIHGLYFTETMYVDLDINPSVELTVNRFDSVIGVYAYNEDGEQLLSSLSLLHKPYRTAVTLLTEAAIEQGFLAEDGLVSVTLQTDGGDDALLTDTLQTDIAAAAKEYLTSVQADVFTVDSDIREHAHEQNISPAKYLAILELLRVDPTATMESCKDHSIGEIRTQAHGGHGKTQTESAGTGSSETMEPSGTDSSVAASDTESHNNGHHGYGHE